MRPAAIVVLAAALAAPSAYASVCTAPSQPKAGPRWTLDHYLYDASLQQDWEVLIDCNHPAVPAQLKLASSTAHSPATKHDSQPSRVTVRAGAAVEISNPAGSPVTIRLSGTAMQAALIGQPIRVRLSAGGHFVTGLVRGPNSVELVAAAKPLWGKP